MFSHINYNTSFAPKHHFVTYQKLLRKAFFPKNEIDFDEQFIYKN